MIKFTHKGDFSKTEAYLKKLQKKDIYVGLDEFGKLGVEALRSATPVRTGKTAESWHYTIKKSKDTVSLSWHNSNINDGVNIAIIIQYGHGTGWGGYVEGQDYINPAIRPLFDAIADNVWKEVTMA